MDVARVAVSGSHGTGKTSLVAEVARRFPGITTFDEPFYLLEDEGHVFGTPPTADDFELLLARSVALLEERQPGPVIFDRSPADYLAYLTAKSRSVREEFVKQVAAGLKSLDLIVLVPIETPDRIAEVEAPRLRRRVDAILHDMLSDGGWGFDVPVLLVRGTLDERANQIEPKVLSLVE